MKNKTQGMSKNTKAAIVAIIIVIIVALVVRGGSDKKVVPPVAVEPTTQETVAKPAVVSGGTKPTPAPIDTRTYTELLNAYKGSTLQFNSLCQVHMSNQVYKTGAQILLDNRSASSAAIKIGSIVHSLGAYGYRVVTLSSSGQFMVDCNEQQNVATLTVQK